MLAQTAPAAVPSASVPSPRLLLKSGLRLTHLFYLPDARSWQLLLPVSFGLEYRLQPRFSAYAQAEADISAGRAPRGRRGSPLLPTPGTSVGMGARYYFNQPSASQSSSEPWGNYVALEASAELAQLSSRRGRRGRGLSVGRVTPALFALCGTQHRGPGRRLLYDLNAGLGIEAPPAYSAEAGTRPPWDVAAQVNLRVYLANQRHAARTSQD
ncbi:hypothetical protein KB206_14640 [Microvirga sp. STS02]|uniref:hypothetical protein n=1 Tax=Hymenobacter negativus TaxID=2795026 RepID=UPI0018DC6C71|nr:MULTISPECIES: hypothetical protein [Bacteria]MBH8570125.1 hypothetical protein [Hymenobacter negativus]MBR7209865.1 hypothetical protein [Microvirga sp. STS02]